MNKYTPGNVIPDGDHLLRCRQVRDFAVVLTAAFLSAVITGIRGAIEANGYVTIDKSYQRKGDSSLKTSLKVTYTLKEPRGRVYGQTVKIDKPSLVEAIAVLLAPDHGSLIDQDIRDVISEAVEAGCTGGLGERSYDAIARCVIYVVTGASVNELVRVEAEATA